MPIKPENKAKYPKDWKHIREQIRARAGDKCEWCGVENHAKGVRDVDGRFWSERDMEFHPMTLAPDARFIRIVCTVAHVHDRDPANCHPDNLAFLCQRCHNRHDAQDRAKNAAATRTTNADTRAGQHRMF